MQIVGVRETGRGRAKGKRSWGRERGEEEDTTSGTFEYSSIRSYRIINCPPAVLPPPPLPYNSFHSYVTAYVATYVRRLVCPAGTQACPPLAPLSPLLPSPPGSPPLQTHPTRCSAFSKDAPGFLFALRCSRVARARRKRSPR